MDKDLIFEVLDVLATYKVSKEVSDLLPVLASLAPVCEPIRKRYNGGNTLDVLERNTLKVFNLIEQAYQSDRLSVKAENLIIDYLDELGEVLEQ